MYRSPSNQHWATIGSQSVFLDSDLEERVIRRLDKNGFAEKWRRPKHGVKVGNSRYTPDIELLVSYDDEDRLALVEIKPTRRDFTVVVARRFCAIAEHYGSPVLLLYADKNKEWYEIDYETASLTVCEAPTPGEGNMSDLRGPFVVPSLQSFYGHSYKVRPLPALLSWIGEVLWIAVMGPPKRSRRRRRR